MELPDPSEGGFISIEIDGDLVYSGALYYIEMLKSLMDVAYQAGLNHDVEQARVAMGILWTTIQPFNIEHFVNTCVQMGGGTVLDAARQLCSIWLNIPEEDEDEPFEVPENAKEVIDAIFESFNQGMVGLVGRLLPNVHVIDLKPGERE